MKTILAIVVTVISVGAVVTPSVAAPPFMNVEGVGGAGIVPGAYRVNQPEADAIVGLPALSSWNILGQGNGIFTNGFSLSVLDRFEIGYVNAINDFGRVRRHLLDGSGGALDVGKSRIDMHVFHFKTTLTGESAYFPATAVTAEFKYNGTIDKMNRNVGRALDGVGYDSDHGVDIDLSASKTIAGGLPIPAMINANLRLTRAHYLGFLGFSQNYTANAEASAAFLPRPDFAFGAEIRQQNDSFGALPLPGFKMKENAFWDVFVSWFPNDKLSLAVAFTHFGNVVDENINFFVFNVKRDF